jgi:hypothetical protein
VAGGWRLAAGGWLAGWRRALLGLRLRLHLRLRRELSVHDGTRLRQTEDSPPRGGAMPPTLLSGELFSLQCALVNDVAASPILVTRCHNLPRESGIRELGAARERGEAVG